MSSNYLLSCTCGETIVVRTQQAGGRTVCVCGKHVDIPKLGELRKLPTVESEETPAQPRWTLGRGLLFSGSLLAAVVSVAVLMTQFREWRQLEVEKPKVSDLMVLEDLDDWSPAESYERWATYWRDQPLIRMYRLKYWDDRQRMAVLNRRMLVTAGCLMVSLVGAGIAIFGGRRPI